MKIKGKYYGAVNSWPIYQYDCPACGNNYLTDSNIAGYCPICGYHEASGPITYTLNCDNCGFIWESEDAFPKICPNCNELIPERVVKLND